MKVQSIRTIANWLRRNVLNARWALTNWADPRANPFLERASRLETRRGRPAITVMIAAFFALGLCALLVWTAANWPALKQLIDGRPSPEPPLFPWPDNHPIGALALVTTAICAYGALFSARSRSSQLLRRELLGNTLDSLQLIPIAEERWLWMMSAHPVALAGLLWLLGLPMYLLAVWTSVWSIGDVFGLLLVFLFIGHAVPAWQPRLWTVANVANSVAAAKAHRARLAEVAREQKTEHGEDQHLTRAQRFERERRLQRAVNSPFSDKSASESETEEDKQSRPSLFSLTKANTRGQFNFPWSAFLYPVFMLWSNFGSLISRLPSGIAELGAWLPISWPLLGARLLLAPWPFFAFALPPVLLLLPLWLVGTQRGILLLAAQVSSGETFWTTHRAARRHALTLAFWAIVVVMLAGYGWEALVENGLLGAALGVSPSDSSWALAALWTLLLAAGTFIGGRALEGPFARAAFDEQEYCFARQEALRGALGAISAGVGAYFLFCWLSARSGWSDPWMTRLTPTLLIALAYLLIGFGGAALGGRLRGEARNRWKMARAAFYVAPLLLLPLHWLAGYYYDWSMDWTDFGYLTISPYGALLSLFRTELWPSGGWIWWCGPFLQIIIGATCLVAARGEVEPEPARESGPTPFWLLPFVLLRRAGLWLDAKIKSFFARIVIWLKAGNENFIRRFERFDQPVLTAELRRRVRRGWWPLQWTIIFLLTGAIVAITFWANAGGTRIGSSIVAGALYIGGPIILLSTLPQGRAFDGDRANGTLVFLFLTPLSDIAILLGKTLPTLIYSAALFGIMSFWLLLGGVLGALSGDVPILLLACSGALAIAAATAAGLFLQAAFGVRARKTGEGQSKGLIVGGATLVALGVMLGLASGAAAGRTLSPLTLVGAFLAASLVGAVAAWLAWRWALRSLQKRRYGDVEIKTMESGTG